MCNVGKVDRIIRAVLGVALIIWAIAVSSWLLGVVGAIALVTSVMSFCPLYALLKIKTGCAKE